MPRIPLTRTNASGTTSGTTNTYTQLVAAVTDSNTERVYLKVHNPSVNTSGVIVTVGEGASASEKGLVSLDPGESYEWKVDERNGINYVPQGRIAVKAVGTSKAFYAEYAEVAKAA